MISIKRMPAIYILGEVKNIDSFKAKNVKLTHTYYFYQPKNLEKNIRWSF